MAGLLDADADELWVQQFHVLHGPDGDDPWRRSRVATDRDGQVIGCATVTSSALHPGRLPCAVDVAPAWRRRGVGSALLAAVGAERPDARPMSSKARLSNTAATAFVTAVGGRPYQHCPGIAVDPRAEDVRRWALARRSGSCRDLVEATDLVSVFAELYRWIHQTWSPAGDMAVLAQVAGEDVADADLTLSSGYWVAGRLTAVAFAFPRGEACDVVAETVTADVPDGDQAVAGVVATTLLRCAERGVTDVQFDGHETDPHLAGVLRDLPGFRADPLALVELP